MSAEGEQIQRRVSFSGRVQGVGFRYTTASIARRHPVTGYVRNRADGTVELVAEGVRKALDAFVQEIEDAFRGNISNTSAADAPADGAFSRFEIRR